VFDWAMLRLTWEPRMLSILRIVVGLLYLQHGLNKFFNFPPTPNHAAYSLFSLNPGLAANLETVGSTLIILGLFTRPVAFILFGEMAVAYFMVNVHRSFSRWPVAAIWVSSIVSHSSTCSSRGAVPGASISCEIASVLTAPMRASSKQPSLVELTRRPLG